MIGRCMRWIKRLDPRAPRPGTIASTAVTSAPGSLPASEHANSTAVPVVRGHADGWLKVLNAGDLLTLVHGFKAMDAMWRQSRLAQIVWERDLLPALHRYAEFVQLMPASESHHHAHVGGLLSHTLEMTLAAMTWRNGHFFPEGASVEEMDAQRDEWTYVVFFGALLHDLGKIMTDLRISWICAGMDAPLRWVPISGPLTSMVQARPDGEYLVEFTPKSARDYQAHSRLATILLQQVAPPTALSFLARRPLAFEALTQYLSGTDKTSLLAQLVRKADQSSTQQALSTGSRERFATSASVPLIDLLMLAIKDMLKMGTALPLNRSGAAGWVHDGSVWFVAKRLADGVRQHIRQHHPDESVPGDNKNDRLFDTWQEYGCILLNPQSGQAIWYVHVHGAAVGPGTANSPSPEGGEGDGSYGHSLTMLRFPLDKLFDEVSQYPPTMNGRIEVLVKRASPPSSTPSSSPSNHEELAQPSAEIGSSIPSMVEPLAQAPKSAEPPLPQPVRHKPDPLRAPAFNRPQAGSKGGAPKLAAPAFKPKPAAAHDVTRPVAQDKPATALPKVVATAPVEQRPQQPMPPANAEPPLDKWLDFDDDAGASFKDFPATPHAKPESAIKEPKAPIAPAAEPALPVERPPAAPFTPKSSKTAAKPVKPDAPRTPVMPDLPPMPADRPLLVRSALPEMSARTAPPQRLQTMPVIISPFLPELPHETASKKTEPTATAIAFIQWLQQGLSNRELKYNESGAMVHFTAEGMALVSPVVFRCFAADQAPSSDGEADAQALQVQREVIKAGWHLMGPGKVNILKYQVMGRGGVPVGKLSAVVLIRPERWVMPVPPINPVLKLA